MPLGALVASKELLEGGFLTSTLAGNSVVAAAALASLKLLKEKNLLQNVNVLGSELIAMLLEVKERHEIVGDVRGKGLFVGIEIVKDKTSKIPARLETAKIVYRAWQLGLITVFVGPDQNVD